MKVLIAERDLEIRTLLRQKLQERGCIVSDFASAGEMFASLSDEDSDLIFADWECPELPGAALYRNLARQFEARSCYLVALTSKQDASQLARAFADGAQAVIPKPLDITLLNSLLSVIERRARTERAVESITESLLCYERHLEEKCMNQTEALVLADRLSSIGRHTAQIAHELNNSMALVAGNLQILERWFASIPELLKNVEGQNSQERRRIEMLKTEVPRMMESMDTGVQRLTRLLSDITSSARVSVFKRERCDLRHVVERAIEVVLARTKGDVTVSTDFSYDLPQIFVDPDRIEQVLINLMINAADAMQPFDRPLISISTNFDKHSIRLRISDNGPGISEEHLPHIFEPFFSTKAPGKGTGIGLYISREIARRHNGRLEVARAETGGAQFELVLPVTLSNEDLTIANIDE